MVRGLGVLEVRLRVAGFSDSDPEEQAELAWRLQEELSSLDVEDVTRAPTAPRAGAKGAALEWAQLVVTLAGTLPALAAAVRCWAERHPGAEVTLEVDGDRVTLSDASPEERQRLLSAWLRRHGDA